MKIIINKILKYYDNAFSNFELSLIELSPPLDPNPIPYTTSPILLLTFKFYNKFSLEANSA